MQQDQDLTRIIEQHAERVRRVLRRRGVAERDVPDAQQEVFLVVHRRLAEFEGRSSLATWLHRIAMNIASEHRRRARNRYESLEAAPADAAGCHDPVSALEARDALARTRVALSGLSDEQREALVLHLAGLSMHEVAEQLGVPLKTAFSRLYAARRNLGTALGQRVAAASALALWLCAFGPSRSLARAHAGGGKTAWLAQHAAQLQVAGLALACTALSSVAEPHAPRGVPIAAATRSALDLELGPAPVVSPRSLVTVDLPRTPAALLDPLSPAVRETARPVAAARHEAHRVAAPARGQIRAVAPVPQLPASEPAAISFSLDELTVTRTSARDPRPTLRHPLAERIAPAEAPLRVRLSAAHEASPSLDERLSASALP